MATRITVHASPLLLKRGVRGVTGQPMEIVVHFPTSPAVSAHGFEIDSAFPGPSLLASLPAFVRAATDCPEARLVLFGHADEAGGDRHNKQLSDRRAKGVFALLTQDLNALDQLARDDAWGPTQYRLILDALGIAPASTQPKRLRAFQRRYNAGEYHQASGRERTHAMLNVDGLFGPRTEAALRDAYLAQVQVSLDPARFIGPKTAGCGEFNRSDSPAQDRRVVLALYRPDFPTESKIPCREGDAASCKLNRKAKHPWKCNFYRRTVEHETPVKAARMPAHQLAFQLLDSWHHSCPNRKFKLSAGSFTAEGTSDAEGYVRCEIPAEITEITLTTWSCGDPDGPGRSVVLALDELDDLSESDESTARLLALGYLGSEETYSQTDLRAAERAYDRVLNPKRAGGSSSTHPSDALLATLRANQAKNRTVA